MFPLQKNGNCSRERKCDCWHLAALQILQEKHMSNEERIVHLYNHNRRIDLPVQTEKVKEKSPKRKCNGCNCEYCKSPSDDYVRKTVAIRNFHEHPHASRGKQVGQSKMPMKSILALKRKLPSEKRSIRFSHQSLEKAKFRDKLPSLSVIHPDQQQKRTISHCTTVRPKIYRVE